MPTKAVKKRPKTAAKRKTFRELCDGKVSVALRAMCNGLVRHSRRKDFRIDMSSYGQRQAAESSSVCFGCAATCTVMEVTGYSFTNGDLPYGGEKTNTQVWNKSFRQQAALVDATTRDLRTFEEAINMARQGMLSALVRYMRASREFVDADAYSGHYGFSLRDGNWREQLPAVRKYIRKLEKLGL